MPYWLFQNVLLVVLNFFDSLHVLYIKGDPMNIPISLLLSLSIFACGEKEDDTTSEPSSDTKRK